MPKVQGQEVTVVRDAKQGDQGFAAGQDQVIIRMQDGTERTVARVDVQGAEPKRPGSPS